MTLLLLTLTMILVTLFGWRSYRAGFRAGVEVGAAACLDLLAEQGVIELR